MAICTYPEGAVVEHLPAMAKSLGPDRRIRRQKAQLHGHPWPPGLHMPAQSETRVTATDLCLSLLPNLILILIHLTVLISRLNTMSCFLRVKSRAWD